MVFVIYFTSILLFLDIYAYYLRGAGTWRRYAALGMFGLMFAAGGFNLLVIQGEPLVAPLAWAAARYAKKNPDAAARRLPVILGIVFFAATLFFLNAHNTSESMFMSPYGVHYWLINVLNDFLAGVLFTGRKAGLDPAMIENAVKSAAGIPLVISKHFLGIAAFISAAGGFGLYHLFRARMPWGTFPAAGADEAFTPPRAAAYLLAASGAVCLFAPLSAARSVAVAALLFCALYFSASGMFFTIRLAGKRVPGAGIIFICAVQPLLVLAPGLLWITACAGVVFRVLGMYSAMPDYRGGESSRPAPHPAYRIYILPALCLLLAAPVREFTGDFQNTINKWLTIRAMPEMPDADPDIRGPFVEIADFRYFFEMDQYEYPNKPGQMPRLVKTAAEAGALCQERGLRLCRLDEWEHVCSSGGTQKRIKRTEKIIGGDRKLCNQNNPNLTTIGEKKFSDCRPDAYEVNEMAGNAWEFVETRGDLPLDALKGGYFGYSDDYTTHCSYTLIMIDGQSEEMEETDFGFRCCR